MKGKRLNLSDQIMGVETKKKITEKLDYQSIINQQQTVIKLLQKQIIYLRQYIFYVADYEDLHSNTNAEESEKDILSQGKQPLNQSTQSSQTTGKKINGLRGLISEVMKVLNVKKPDEVINKLNIMKEKANRRIDPIFVERIKEKQVPVTVEKQVIVEKIVEKVVQKVIEVPVFKQKIVQKFIVKPLQENTSDSSSSYLNSNQINIDMKKKHQNSSFIKGYIHSPRNHQITSPRYRQKNGKDKNAYFNKTTTRYMEKY